MSYGKQKYLCEYSYYFYEKLHDNISRCDKNKGNNAYEAENVGTVTTTSVPF